MSAKNKPQKGYVILYKDKKARLFSFYLEGDSLGLSSQVTTVFNKIDDRVNGMIRRAIKVCHASRTEQLGNDYYVDKVYRDGKVFVERIGSKTCPIKIQATPLTFDSRGTGRVSFLKKPESVLKEAINL